MRSRGSDWKTKWEQELDATLPELRADVREHPIPASHKRPALRRKRVDGPHYALLALAAVLLLMLCFTPVLRELLQEPPAEGETGTLIALHINPSVAFAADSEGKVVQLLALNADADVILSHAGFAEEVIGLPLTEAIVRYTDLAARLGYLDPNTQGDAVCLRVCEGASLHAESAVAELEDYFCRLGARIAVAEEKLSRTDFSALIGTESVEDLLLAPVGTAVLFGERALSALTEQELQAHYESTVLCGEVKETLSARLHSRMEQFSAHAEALLHVTELSGRVLAHPDNPGIFIKNYWYLAEESDPAEYTPSFASLMTEMECALADYAEAYGREIASVGDLLSLTEESVRWSVENLLSLLEDFSDALLLEHADDLLTCLESIGEDTEQIRALLTPPTTAEEFLGKHALALQMSFDTREESGREAYNTEREPLGQKEYLAFLDAVKAEYGSLADYWKTQNP